METGCATIVDELGKPGEVIVGRTTFDADDDDDGPRGREAGAAPPTENSQNCVIYLRQMMERTATHAQGGIEARIDV